MARHVRKFDGHVRADLDEAVRRIVAFAETGSRDDQLRAATCLSRALRRVNKLLVWDWLKEHHPTLVTPLETALQARSGQHHFIPAAS